MRVFFGRLHILVNRLFILFVFPLLVSCFFLLSDAILVSLLRFLIDHFACVIGAGTTFTSESYSLLPLIKHDIMQLLIIKLVHFVLQFTSMALEMYLRL